MTKKSYIYDRFFVSDQIFTTEHVITAKNSRFFQGFCSKIQVFPGFFQNFLNSWFFLA